MAETEVLITGERSKLPADIATLLDPSVPLPEGVLFFEKRFDISDMLRQLLISGGLALAALVLLPLGVMMVFDQSNVTVASQPSYYPLGLGLVCALAAWMMLLSVRTSWQLRREQKLGRPTRYGTFLTPTAFVQASESDTTVIPPLQFRGLNGSDVKYFHKNAEKSFRLPSAWTNATTRQVQEAIMRWAGGPKVGEHPAQSGLPGI